MYGLVLGLCSIPLTAIAGLLLGILLAVIEYLAGVRAEGSWVGLAGLICGFYVGIPVGLIVWYKVCRSRLRDARTEELN